ncbi:MAG: hypothetical protein JW798_07670 [Prolixibacteraceae bacterium]|nr:hypothetical protein [Prolixibacteraceae bacterium]
MINTKYILLFFMLIVSVCTHGQQQVFKVSKLINKTVSTKITTIEIISEKATVEIIGWDKNEIEIQMRLISRNPIQKKAKADLKYIRTELSEEEKHLFIRNYFDGKNSRITSNLSVEYQLYVPDGISLKIKNLYGKILLEKLNNPADIDLSFGSLSANKIKGNISGNLSYSTVTGNNIDGILNFKSEKTDINIDNLNATISIDARYGEISFSLLDNIKAVSMNCHRTKIDMQIPEKPFNYKLKNLYSEIKVPGLPTISYDEYQKQVSGENATLNISTSYCPITIKHKQHP